MHIESTDRRAREWEALQEATGESRTAGALDVATRCSRSSSDPRGPWAGTELPAFDGEPVDGLEILVP